MAACFTSRIREFVHGHDRCDLLSVNLCSVSPVPARAVIPISEYIGGQRSAIASVGHRTVLESTPDGYR
jgi:hypothetical protein